MKLSLRTCLLVERDDEVPVQKLHPSNNPEPFPEFREPIDEPIPLHERNPSRPAHVDDVLEHIEQMLPEAYPHVIKGIISNERSVGDGGEGGMSESFYSALWEVNDSFPGAFAVLRNYIRSLKS